MKQDIKEKWVSALRSGKYKQGTGYLIQSRNDNEQCEYCCLGVLCDLYAKEHGFNLAWNRERISDSEEINIASLYGTEFVLPYQVQQWAGLHDASPCVEYDGHTEMLSELNDHDHLDFNGLANLIDEDL